LYGCKTCFLTVREKHKFRVPDYRALRKMFEPKCGGTKKEERENYIMRSFIFCTVLQILSCSDRGR
jgi:hypothetical protein